VDRTDPGGRPKFSGTDTGGRPPLAYGMS
jgi:hypothetical protein